MISVASYDDINELKSLYENSFGDSKEYIDFYYKNCFSPKDCFIYKENDKIISSLFQIDVKLSFHTKQYRGRYIYAACTHSKYRSKGKMSDLIRFCLRDLKEKGYDFSTLVPQDEGLFNYYEKLGYKNFFYIGNCNLEKNKISDNKAEFQNISFDEFIELRKQYLSTFPITLNFTDMKILRYIYDEVKFSGGSIYKINFKGKIGYIIFYELDKHLYIKESSFTVQEIQLFLRSIINLDNFDLISIRTFPDKESTTKFGMLFMLSNNDLNVDMNSVFPYFNLVLD